MGLMNQSFRYNRPVSHNEKIKPLVDRFLNYNNNFSLAKNRREISWSVVPGLAVI